MLIHIRRELLHPIPITRAVRPAWDLGFRGVHSVDSKK